jgi:hypothetical protein
MEHDEEAVRGLPRPLPPGETILWQGAPDARVFLRGALHARWVGAYFAALTLYSLAQASLFGASVSFLAGLGCLGLMALFAWGVAKTSVYTLTNKRIVLRIGVALSACINLPLARTAAADLRPLERGHGDIALTLDGGRISYVFLWPHARAWRFASPQPMLRAVPEAEKVATLLVAARQALGPITQPATEPAAPFIPLGAAA